MRKITMGLITFSIIDILYTTIGAISGMGGAELNPMFSWIHDPIIFVLYITLIKMIVIGGVITGILYLDEYEREHKHKFAWYIGAWANIVYAAMLFGILGLNVWYQIYH